MLTKRSLLALVAASGFTIPAIAHHSHAQYDTTGYTYVEGVVAEVHWFNPHAWVYLSVAGEDGDIRLWQPDSGQVVARASGHSSDIVQLAFDPDTGVLGSA